MIIKKVEQTAWVQEQYTTKSGIKETYIGSEKIVKGYYYEVLYKDDGEYRVVPYKFKTYKQAIDFCRYYYGGNMTEELAEVFEQIDQDDKSKVGVMPELMHENGEWVEI